MTELGATIGILGGGQLGRMLILAGRPLGYRFHVFEPKAPCSAGLVADAATTAQYDDSDALRSFARSVDRVTLEFENIPVSAIDAIEAIRPVAPGRRALWTCQHREREKAFLRDAGFPCAPFEYAEGKAELEAAVERIGRPCVIKTAAFGYDGKGQVKLEADASTPDFDAVGRELGSPGRVVVERWIEHAGEFSVVCARAADGSWTTLPMTENIHVDHILHTSIAPARADDAVRRRGAELAGAIAEELGVVGLIAVEFFLDPSGELLVNEMAPRPHNSGHYSIDACVTSQFEQHLRAIAGLPFGSTELVRPAAMTNLLGDVWASGEPDWRGVFQDPRAKLHLYDKGEARPGRKMGHYTVLDPDREEAIAGARAVMDALDPAGAARMSTTPGHDDR